MATGIDRLICAHALPEAQLGRIRAEQISAIIRLTPVMMLGNLIGALVILFEIGNPDMRPLVGLVVAALIIFAALGIFKAVRMRRQPPRRWASATAVARAARHAVILSLLWSLIFIFGYVGAEPAQKLLVFTVVAGFGIAGAFTLAPMPQAALALLVPVTGVSTVSLLLEGSTPELALALLEIFFCGLVLFACMMHARLFVARLCAEHNAIEKQAVISMLLKSLEDNASDCLWQLDSEYRFTHVSERFQLALNAATTDLRETSVLTMLRGNEDMDDGSRKIIEALEARVPFREIETRFGPCDNATWWRLTGEPTFDELGQFLGFRGVGSDITEGRAAADRLLYMARHDGLTGALNRARFTELLAEAVASRRRRNGKIALAYIDLDGFKAVNDTIGHRAGDHVLVEVVKRLQASLPAGCLLGRLGGDEFSILFTAGLSVRALQVMAAAIITRISEPYELEGTIINVGASVGIAVAEAALTQPEELLQNADLALHHAKSAGKLTYRFHSAEMSDELSATRALESDLSFAMGRDQLELHYQPFVSTRDSSVAGFEALVRWRHPERGLVSPEQFIHLAERSSLICEVGVWVLREACRVASQWPEHLTIAINLSSRHLTSPGLVPDIRAALEASGLAPGRLEIEITESVLIEHPEIAIEALAEIRRLGVRVAMDDFGTGYSGLSYLWRLPFDKIKIDGSFVAAITRDDGARRIIAAICSLARSMGLSIAAERIEIIEELEYLRDIHVDFLQGYHFSKPLPECELAAYLMRDFETRIRRQFGPAPEYPGAGLRTGQR